MLDGCGNHDLPGTAFDGQLSFLARSSSEQRPDLPHGCTSHGDIVHGDQAVAGFDAFHRGLAIEIRYAQNCVTPIVLRPQHESDDIEIRKVEHSPDVEVHGG